MSLSKSRNDVLYQVIGLRIKAERRRQGIVQGDLAESAGLTRLRISKPTSGPAAAGGGLSRCHGKRTKGRRGALSAAKGRAAYGVGERQAGPDLKQ